MAPGRMETKSRESSPRPPEEQPEQVQAEAGGYSRIWDWLTFIGVLVLVFHLLGLWYRWARPDPQFLAFTGGVAGLLAWASLLGLQTDRGRRLAIRLDEVFSFRRLARTPPRACLATWVAAAIVALLLYGGSPLAAYFYNRRGAEALEAGRYNRALRSFRQALSLSPNNAHTHYNLAFVYETTHETDRATAEYRAALEMDDGFWEAYINLGHLYLVQGDPDAALTMLLSGERRVIDPLGQAVMAKNVGWAYLDKGLPRTALSSLDQARAGLQALRQQGKSVEIYLAEVARLQALAQQSLEQTEKAQRAWQDSLGYALAVSESPACTASTTRPPADCLDALRWAAEAREALAPETGGP